MSRRRYPSDERRNESRNPPFFKVHTSIQNHPKMIEIFPDDHLLATWLRLGVLCRDRGVAETENWIALTTFDAIRVTSCARFGRALAQLRLICGLMQWQLQVNRRPVSVRINFRNYAKKQGFTPRKLRNTTPNPRNDSAKTTPSPSPYITEEYKERSSKETPPETTPNPRSDRPRQAAIALLVREIIALTGDDQQRSVAYFVRVATVLPEPSTRRLIAETRAAVGNGGEVRSVARYFTALAKRELVKQTVSVGG